ncbi:hypothetical protein [Synechococcus sp. PCC 7336]|nr:hypothetical protein [Synechococcus sp. PCC 7336]
MADVLLKTGELIRIPDDEIAAYLEEHTDDIESRQFRAKRKPIKTSA